MNKFANRREAGRLLAQQLVEYSNNSDVVVLALPRGGVPVGYEVAAGLSAPLDVFVVRKIGTPWNEELAIGAVASGGTWILDTPLIRDLRIDNDDLHRIIARELRELDRRERLYRGGRPLTDLAGRVVIVVDDGLATGSSMLAAVGAIRGRSPASIIVATPVASRSACLALRRVADACVALMTPEPLYGVGMYYEDFSQTSDDEVLALLKQAAEARAEAVVA
jgi:putative phosphoribosyl transferase